MSTDLPQVPPLDRLRGRRILIVEDEFIVSLEIEGLLTQMGCVIVGPAARVAEALAMIEGDDLDGAIVDLNLDGDDADGVIEALTRRSVPFIIVTGYGVGGLSPATRGLPRLSKPIATAELRTMIHRLFRGPGQLG
ncbi:response regulator [Marinivivus vitaminiproducens]|uniref:response regulator n=1 Tax=Marinivivus vitaminiproducens TaxID=3035935 RepID=UPI0027AA72BC|nr:response regulator [Geminicoccaceae bacterium SCSIO 64248]